MLESKDLAQRRALSVLWKWLVWQGGPVIPVTYLSREYDVQKQKGLGLEQRVAAGPNVDHVAYAPPWTNSPRCMLYIHSSSSHEKKALYLLATNDDEAA